MRFVLLSLSILLLGSSQFVTAHDLGWEDLHLQRDHEQILDKESVGVRLSGYLLPLAISGSEVTEFLLVPSVGACVGEPCPSADQLVYVIPDQGIEVEGLFDPVRVTGLLSVQTTTHILSVLNLADEIPVAYRLEADLVEKY